MFVLAQARVGLAVNYLGCSDHGKVTVNIWDSAKTIGFSITFQLAGLCGSYQKNGLVFCWLMVHTKLGNTSVSRDDFMLLENVSRSL